MHVEEWGTSEHTFCSLSEQTGNSGDVVPFKGNSIELSLPTMPGDVSVGVEIWPGNGYLEIHTSLAIVKRQTFVCFTEL